ncbi:hypothetical protein BN1263370077 [Stenotrophomonas maltophilia]|nr:hypothetical protein BN1263370077 [Stenotrophomonas maltophilia]
MDRTGSCRGLPEGLAAGRTRIGGHHGQHRSARRDGSGRGDAGPVGAGHAIGSDWGRPVHDLARSCNSRGNLTSAI